MERTGIGDAELARRIPVSRPTLLRWKEGVTTRPRHRDDVLRCAELLRLTPEETNAFLLAAGFSAETAPPVAPPVAPTEKAPDALDVTPTPSGPADALVVGSQSPETSPPTRVPRFLRSNRRFLLVSVAIPLLVIATVIAVVAIKSGDSAVYPVAGDGESMILLAPFVNYTAGGQGFNVVGRLKSAVDSELQEAGLTTVRTVEWPKELEGEESALQAGQQTNAALVIWGEYDSGRVIARFTVPSDGSASQAQQVVDIASTPAELPATINLGLTDEVRHVALVTLGQLYLEQEEFDLAKTVLASAMHPPPSEDEALANLRFLLGRAYLDGKWADFDEAVWLFSQVLAVQPRSVEALNSRALAYLARARPGDAALGVDDLERALTIEPQRAATNLNLAVAYMERGAVGDVDRAIASLSEALEMQEDYASAYVNRAGAYVARGSATDLERAFNDLEKVLGHGTAAPFRVPRSWERLLGPRAQRRPATCHQRVQPRHRSLSRLAPALFQPWLGPLTVGRLGPVSVRSATRSRTQPSRRYIQQHPLLATRGHGTGWCCAGPTATRRWLATSPASPATAAAWPTPL